MEKGTLTFRLNPYLRGIPDYKKTRNAVRKLRSLIQRHTKTEDVRLGPYLNKKLWERGKKSPPNKIQVEISKVENHIFAELVGAPKEAVKEEKKKKKTVKEKIKEKKEDKPKEEKKAKKPQTKKKEMKEKKS